MSLTEKLSNSADSTFWKELDTPDRIAEIRASSFERPALIFKHSTRCGISAMAKFQLEKDWNFKPGELDIYLLDLIRYRNLSNQITDTFGVPHQSPQVLILLNGQVIYHTSHHMIGVERIREALSEGVQ